MREVIPLLTIAKRGGLAIVLSIFANLGIFALVRGFDLVEPFGALTVPPITFLTVLGGVAATAVYGAITRVSTRPDWVFVRVAAVALLLSFIPDIVILRFDPEATLGAVLVLMLMHIVVATICVATLTARIR